MQELTDVRYEVDEGLCWITIDRPERLNSFTAHTVDELIECFKRAWADPEVGVVALTGAGDRAFCAGGDQKQRAQSGDYGPSETGLFEIESLHRVIREIPKPVIAAVNGLAIGGGHVLHVICDLSIAAEHALFGQAGPRVGSFDAGFGTAYLARVVCGRRAPRPQARWPDVRARVRWLPPRGAPAEDDREMPAGPRTRTLAVCLLAALATCGGLAGGASAAKRTLWRQHRAEHAIRQREK